jgi:hypothetical protein
MPRRQLPLTAGFFTPGWGYLEIMGMVLWLDVWLEMHGHTAAALGIAWIAGFAGENVENKNPAGFRSGRGSRWKSMIVSDRELPACLLGMDTVRKAQLGIDASQRGIISGSPDLQAHAHAERPKGRLYRLGVRCRGAHGVLKVARGLSERLPPVNAFVEKISSIFEAGDISND